MLLIEPKLFQTCNDIYVPKGNSREKNELVEALDVGGVSQPRPTNCNL